MDVLSILFDLKTILDIVSSWRTYENPRPKTKMIVAAPDPMPECDNRTVFLGGTIAGGRAPNWQTKLVDDVHETENQIIWLNPRRDVWTESDGHAQVDWEINAQQTAWGKVYWFEPGFDSPVTLMEVGLFADSKTVVGCSREYKYRFNVEAAQRIKGFRLVDTWGEFVAAIDEMIRYDWCVSQ